MLTVFDNGIGHPLVYDDYYIRELASGLNEIIFNMSVRDENYRYIVEEAIVRDRDEQEYLIKQIDAGEDRAKVVCQINIDDWKADMHLDYSNESKTVGVTITEIAPQGWTVVDRSLKVIRRTIPQSDDTKDFNVTSWEVVQECCDVYSVRVQFDTKNKIIYIINPDLAVNVGAFASRDLNLVKLNYKGKSDSFVTRLYAVGADGLTFESINGGKPYVENYTYSQKVISAYWQDDRYTDKQSLLDDATEKLAEMAKPSRSYDCEVLDLAKTNPEVYNFENFALFNVITLVDDVKEERVDYQIVERWDYPYYPAKNKIVLSSVVPNLQSVVTSIVNAINNPVSVFSQKLVSTVLTTTSLITGNRGGYLILKDSNGDGYPDELLIMDTDDIATATQVWRWNKSGLGYSSTGYNGTYTLGMNMLGQINASMIATGALDAGIITVGILQDALGENYWDMTTGEFRISSGAKVGSGNDTIGQAMTDISNLKFDVNALDVQISGIFANYTGSAVPTTSNYPASSWADADKPLHVGEVYYKTPQTAQDAGVYYRFTETSGVYSWEVIDTTDGNYAVVSSEFRQTKSLISQEVASSATTINNSINENFANYVKTTTPTTSNSPASSWTTDALKLEHNGDICYDKTHKKYYKWTVTFNADGSINTANWVQQTVSHKYDLVTSTSKSRMEQTDNSFSIAVGAERTAREQADLAATYNYTGTTAPTNPWSDADRNHVGEIYYRSDTQQYYVFEQTGTNTYGWVQTTVSRAFDLTTISNTAKFNMAEDEILLEVSESEKRLFANYTGEVTPTNSNYPASSWTTSALRKEHVNEVYYDTVAGKYYKFGARKPNQIQIQVRYATESPNDYLDIIVPNAANNTASVYKITGGDTSSQSSYSIRTIYFEIPEDNIYFKWHTDSSNSYYGYHFNGIKKVYNGDNPTTEPDEIVTNPTYPSSPSSFQSDSAHPYTNNQDIDFIAITSELPILSPGYEWSEIATDDMPFSTVSSQIRQTAEEISLKVSKGDVVSEINLSTDAITLNTAGRLIITAGNFQLDAQGNLTAANATLTGVNIDGGSIEVFNDTRKMAIQDARITFYEDDVQCGLIHSEYANEIGAEFLEIESPHRVQILAGDDTVITSRSTRKGITVSSDGTLKVLTNSGYNSIEASRDVLVKGNLYVDNGIGVIFNSEYLYGVSTNFTVDGKYIQVRHGIITSVT